MAKTGVARKDFSSEAELGYWIAYQLRRRRMRQGDLARRIGVAQPSLNQVMFGLRASKRIRAALAKTLGYTDWEALRRAQRACA